MRSRRYLKSLLAVAASVLLTGMLMGQGCPQSVTITLDGSNLQDLLSSVTGQGDQSGLGGVSQGMPGMGGMRDGGGDRGGSHGGGWSGGLHGGKDALLWQTYTSAPITATFTPTATGQIVDIAVAGNDSASRVTLTVADSSGASVATSAAATSSVTRLAFTPEATGAYTLTATETGTAATKYAVLVTQPLHESGEAGHGLGGSLLYTTFAAAPVVLTFTATEATTPVEVLVAGNNTASRLSFTVEDSASTVVASVTTPSTNASSVRFAPAAAGMYTLTVTEGGTAATLYVASVVQSDRATCDLGGRGGASETLLRQSATTAPITATFTPATGLITQVAVGGNRSASRITITVTDSGGATVATSAAATTNVTTVSFTPETAGTYTLTATETGTVATRYAVKVVQPYHDGVTFGDETGGVLLRQVFASAPISASFAVADTTEAIKVVLSGDNSASRITFTVTSPSGTVVASVTNPSASASSVSFTPSETGAYTLAATETGTASTVYVAKVVQSSQDEHP